MPTNNQAHKKFISVLYLSTFLERFIYWGGRSILLLFMVGLVAEGGLGMEDEVAFSAYGDFRLMIYLMPLIGAIIADFLLTKLKTAICGGVTLFVGFVLLTSCSANQLFYALMIIAFGFGLITPAIFGLLARSYSDQPSRLSGVFTLNYLIVNFSAFLAPIIVAGMLYPLGFNVAFYSLGAVGAGLAFLLFYFRNTFEYYSNAIDGFEDKPLFLKWLGFGSVLLLILISFLYNVSFEGMNDFVWQEKQERVGTSLILLSTNTVSVILIGILLAFFWFKLKVSNWIKLSTGIFLYALSWQYIGYLIASVSEENMLSYYVAGEVIFSVSELLIVPVLFALIAQYSPRKITATSYALLTSVSALANLAIGVFGEWSFDGIFYIVFSSVLVSFLIILGYIMVNRWNVKSVVDEIKVVT